MSKSKKCFDPSETYEALTWPQVAQHPKGEQDLYLVRCARIQAYAHWIHLVRMQAYQGPPLTPEQMSQHLQQIRSDTDLLIQARFACMNLTG